MTIEERMARVENSVEKLANETRAFIDSAKGFNATITDAIARLAANDQAQNAAIHRLDEMITRFDAWLRGQGPKNGHER
jgi:hypothetical protein